MPGMVILLPCDVAVPSAVPPLIPAGDGSMTADVYSLPYCNASMKASHNSYQRDEDLIQQILWHANAPADGACRGLELDISQSKTGNKWSVGHLAGYHTDYRQLSQFLAE